MSNSDEKKIKQIQVLQDQRNSLYQSKNKSVAVENHISMLNSAIIVLSQRESKPYEKNDMLRFKKQYDKIVKPPYKSPEQEKHTAQGKYPKAEIALKHDNLKRKRKKSKKIKTKVPEIANTETYLEAMQSAEKEYDVLSENLINSLKTIPQELDYLDEINHIRAEHEKLSKKIKGTKKYHLEMIRKIPSGTYLDNDRKVKHSRSPDKLAIKAKTDKVKSIQEQYFTLFKVQIENLNTKIEAIIANDYLGQQPDSSPSLKIMEIQNELDKIRESIITNFDKIKNTYDSYDRSKKVINKLLNNQYKAYHENHKLALKKIQELQSRSDEVGKDMAVNRKPSSNSLLISLHNQLHSIKILQQNIIMQEELLGNHILLNSIDVFIHKTQKEAASIKDKLNNIPKNFLKAPEESQREEHDEASPELRKIILASNQITKEIEALKFDDVIELTKRNPPNNFIDAIELLNIKKEAYHEKIEKLKLLLVESKNYVSQITDKRKEFGKKSLIQLNRSYKSTTELFNTVTKHIDNSDELSDIRKELLQQGKRISGHSLIDGQQPFQSRVKDANTRIQLLAIEKLELEKILFEIQTKLKTVVTKKTNEVIRQSDVKYNNDYYSDKNPKKNDLKVAYETLVTQIKVYQTSSQSLNEINKMTSQDIHNLFERIDSLHEYNYIFQKNKTLANSFEYYADITRKLDELKKSNPFKSLLEEALSSYQEIMDKAHNALDLLDTTSEDSIQEVNNLFDALERSKKGIDSINDKATQVHKSPGLSSLYLVTHTIDKEINRLEIKYAKKRLELAVNVACKYSGRKLSDKQQKNLNSLQKVFNGLTDKAKSLGVDNQFIDSVENQFKTSLGYQQRDSSCQLSNPDILNKVIDKRIPYLLNLKKDIQNHIKENEGKWDTKTFKDGAVELLKDRLSDKSYELSDIKRGRLRRFIRKCINMFKPAPFNSKHHSHYLFANKTEQNLVEKGIQARDLISNENQMGNY